ncbi:MAG: ATP-dependent helicase HrpB [Polyangiaceae bacterium]
MLPLPIDPVLPEITSRLTKERRLVLVAPPGSGKTTRVPGALLDAGTSGEVVVLEPRRLAARMAAKRVADERGEPLGKTIGYTVRFDDVSSPETRVRFVTEGVLARRLLTDPALTGVSAVLLDEFHERHLQSDTVLALLRQSAPDVMLLVMSATLESTEIASSLGCGVIHAEGRPFPVQVSFDDTKDDRALALRVASGVRRALDETAGHVLVFLPGASEIRAAATAAEKLVRDKGAITCVLHGDLPPAEQDAAVAPSKVRKVIFSTNVAESSVTIEGVTAVVDSGLARQSVFDPWTGFARLETAPICQSSAVQRAGRAGRTGPGIAIRLYSKVDFDRRPAHALPEIETADLSTLMLELSAHDRRDVPWLTPPPAGAVRSATELLTRLSAIDAEGRVTDLGREMARYPLHPRQSRLLLAAATAGYPEEGRVLAALLTERDLRREARTFAGAAGAHHAHRSAGDSDLLELLSLFEELRDQRFGREASARLGLDAHVASRVDRVEKQLRRMRESRRVEPSTRAPTGDEALLRAILVAFPDRVAKRKAPGSREMAIASAGKGELSQSSCVHHAPYIVAVDVENVRGVPTARLASRVEPEWLLDHFPERIESVDDARWNEEKAAAERVSQLVYDAIVIDESTNGAPTPAQSALLFAKAKAKGWSHFDTGHTMSEWRARVRFAAAQDARVVDWTEERMDEVFREACEGLRSFRELEGADLAGLLVSKTEGRAFVDALAPTHYRFPNGRSAPIDYTASGSGPVLGSYLQDFFGVKDMPKAGRQALVLHLWAPNKRAVQITQDLPSFWKNHYQTIRKELSRKYPRHVWPDDPTIPQKPLKSQNR